MVREDSDWFEGGSADNVRGAGGRVSFSIVRKSLFGGVAAVVRVRAHIGG